MRILVFLAYFILLSAQDGRAADQIPLAKLITQIRQHLPNFVVGFESILGAKDLINSGPQLILDPPSIAKMVATQTDYQCIIGADYLLIIPKQDPSRHDTPLALRSIIVEGQSSVDQTKILTGIKSIDQSPFFLDPPFIYNSSILGRVISIKGGQYTTYGLLNEMARKIGAKYWEIFHLEVSDPKTHKVRYPVKLGAGNVSFFG